MDTKHVGGNIRRIRQYQGLTQQVLADKVGVSRSMIKRIENDSCITKYDIMQRICYVLNVELETLEKDLPKTF